MRTVYNSSGIVIIIGAVITITDCSPCSFCPNDALA